MGRAIVFCGTLLVNTTIHHQRVTCIRQQLGSVFADFSYHDVPVIPISARERSLGFLTVIGVLIIHLTGSLSALKTGAMSLSQGNGQCPAFRTSLFLAGLIAWVLVLGLRCWIGRVVMFTFPSGPTSV